MPIALGFLTCPICFHTVSRKCHQQKYCLVVWPDGTCFEAMNAARARERIAKPKQQPRKLKRCGICNMPLNSYNKTGICAHGHKKEGV